MNHTQILKSDLPIAIRNTKTFQGFETFKKGLTLRLQNIDRIHGYYQQACKYGIGYLKQNPNCYANEVAIIEEIINS